MEEEKERQREEDLRKRKEEERRHAELVAQAEAEAAKKIAAYKASTQKEKEEEKSWWEKAVDWVDEHQSTIALAAGVVVGAVAVAVSGGGLLPVVATWLGGMTLVGAGTAGLNAYYDRPLGQNVIKNVLITGVSAITTTGVGMIIKVGGLVQAAYRVGQMGTAFCAQHPTACQNAEFALKALDTIEEVSLAVQSTVQTIMGDEAGAAQTALELQLELQDGGIPGNSFANEAADIIQSSSDEVADLINKYGDDIAAILAKHGDDALDLIERYGDDAAEILVKYGDEGLDLLSKHGEDAIDLIGLYGDDAAEILTQYGDEGLVLLSTHGDDSIVVLNNLQTTIDEQALSGIVDQDQITQTASAILNNSNDVIPLDNPDVLGYFLKTGPEGVEYVSNYSNNVDDVLKTVEAISAAEQLSIIGSNSDEARELIDTIVDASTHGTGDKVVIGQWVEDGYGYIEYASDTEGIFFDTPPGLYDATGSQRSIMEEINQEFLRKQLEDGIPTIELFNETIEEVRLNRPDSFTCMELDFLEEVAPQYGYTLVDNAWVLVE